MQTAPTPNRMASFSFWLGMGVKEANMRGEGGSQSATLTLLCSASL